jgi:phytoene/squalene synthetase
MKPVRSLGPVLLLQGLTVNRRRPDPAALARERDPERFVWRVLPHAARSFAASIVILPPDQARAAAVAYLYCRMLDTYEDLHPDPGSRASAMRRFAARFDADPMPPPEPIAADLARDARDRVHLMLVERCGLVDSVFASLPEQTRNRIGSLVAAMASEMAWASDAFDIQGGVLADEQQLARYCRGVIGHPAVFALDLVAADGCTDAAREDAFRVSEMIQLANVSRDIEVDLGRGIGYHPALKPYLGADLDDPEVVAVVREVRGDYMRMALGRAGSYRRLFEGLDLGGTASVRTAAVLMLLFTDLHYRGCAEITGNRTWPGPRNRIQVVARSVPALVSARWARRMLRDVERNFLTAQRRISTRTIQALITATKTDATMPAAIQ